MSGFLFSITDRDDNTSKVLKKIANKKTIKTNNLDKMSLMTSKVTHAFSTVADKLACISDVDTLEVYLNKIIKNNIYCLDVETTGLDSITDTLVGISLYTLNEKSIYIPVNHISYITKQPIKNNIALFDLSKLFKKIKDVPCVLFNAKFDYKFILNKLGISINIYWDCYLAARLLNSNEEANSLKQLYQKYIDKNGTNSFGEYFNNITFDNVPIKAAYLYAANDTLITYELYKFQFEYLHQDGKYNKKRKDLQDLSKVFFDIEMPCVYVFAEMENNGISFDKDYCNKLLVSYTEKLNNIEKEIMDFLDSYSNTIDKYRNRTDQKNKLDNPININSTIQVAILLYDIFKLDSPDKKNPRGTGEEILKKINHPFTQMLLNYRELSKLLSTYIKALPELVNPKTNKIHTNYNQYGADTGRTSSNNPNLQNIPSKNKEIRKMFIASENHYLISCDYSAQEPRLVAHLAKDKVMIKTFVENKDIYCGTIAEAYKKDYKEVLHIQKDGTVDKKKEKIRDGIKTVYLGSCYGRGDKSIMEQLKCSLQEVVKLKEALYRGCPGLLNLIEDSFNMAKELGYVTTVWGRKRHLPHAQLADFEVSYLDIDSFIDPLDFTCIDTLPAVTTSEYKYWVSKMKNAFGYMKRLLVIEDAKKQGFLIKDNTGLIAEAKRQSINSRIQGSAADQIKKAMVIIHNNKELRKLGYKLLLNIHDELIGECPISNIKKCTKIVEACMVEAGKDLIVPTKVDCEVTKAWYGEPISLDSLK